MALINIGPETEQVEYKKSIGEMNYPAAELRGIGGCYHYI